MNAVGAGLDGRIENRAGGTTQFSAEFRSLNLELLNRVDRRQNDVVGAVQEVDGVGVVVDAVKQVVVLRRTETVCGKGAEAALPLVSACGVCMPAPSCARKVKLRPLSGREFTSLWLITCPTEASSVWSKGAQY